ncbi:hypothetical protein GUJ93_ZPchr0012g20539 [Zizania palustris]|uniref:Uncharacterized protein n=1 Tax=Zizania palustris TaxID=103762 RepID=A0A8J6BTN1_ZIZPA|nr:hypothetical protein GUJ93_ZPchr0012g20539 [Zizania palustris]
MLPRIGLATSRAELAWARLDRINELIIRLSSGSAEPRASSTRVPIYTHTREEMVLGNRVTVAERKVVEPSTTLQLALITVLQMPSLMNMRSVWPGSR